MVRGSLVVILIVFLLALSFGVTHTHVSPDQAGQECILCLAGPVQGDIARPEAPPVFTSRPLALRLRETGLAPRADGRHLYRRAPKSSPPA